MFVVFYLDDNGRKHLTIINSMAELNFIKDRFEKVNYEPIKDYLETIKEGDLLQVILRMCSKPIYEEGGDDNGSKKTLMGRSLGRSKRKIIGNEEVIEMIDIDTERTERGKYNLDLGIATDDQDLPF